jgi:hypothetical protein
MMQHSSFFSCSLISIVRRMSCGLCPLLHKARRPSASLVIETGTNGSTGAGYAAAVGSEDDSTAVRRPDRSQSEGRAKRELRARVPLLWWHIRGIFVVTRAGEGYDAARASRPNRKFRFRLRRPECRYH